MKIDTTTIEGYSDMTAEQKLAALEAYEYEDNAAELERLRNANSKANSEAAEWKRKHNALLTEEQQKKQAEDEELSNIRTELETLRKEKLISEYTAKYIALGYDNALAADTAKAMAEGNMETVFANGEKHRAALEKSIKANLMQNDPRPGGSGGGDDDPSDDPAVAKAKQLAQSRSGNRKSYEETLAHYKK